MRLSFPRAHRGIAIVLALFIVLGVLYSVTTPLFEAPDEQWHFAFVQYVATRRALPVQTTGTPQHLARQEGSQPPLYYMLAAAATAWIDTSDFPGIVWENPHYGYNVPGIVNDNKNLFIHTAVESFPYSGAALAIHLSRLLSVAMGALAVLFTYLLAAEVFPQRRYLAGAAAAVVAFVPQFVFVSSAVSNDSTIVALSALSLWLMVRMLTANSNAPATATAMALGAATGLAALAKVSGAGLVLLAALVVVFAGRHDRNRLVVNFVAFGAVVFLIAGWWYLRNFLLYGELTGTAMMVRIFGARETPLTGTQLLAQLAEVWETFWVGFGWGNIRAQPWMYTLLQVAVALSGLGLVVRFIRRSRVRGDENRAAVAVLALWVGVVFIELINWMETTQAPHGRLFFPALPALAPLAVLGIVQWVPARWHRWAARAPAVALGVFATVAPFAILQPAYAYPTTLDRAPVPAHRTDITYGARLKLLGYDLSPERAPAGGSVQLTLYWQALATMDTDYTVGIRVLDADRRAIGARDSYPGHGMLPTRLWYSGQMIRDTFWLPISADAAPGTVVQLYVALYDRTDKQELIAVDPAGQGITPVIGRLKLAGPARPAPRAQNAMQAGFGKGIALIGYDAASNSNRLALTLYWKRSGPIVLDYTTFVHVLDASGKLVAQQDAEPANGANPTTLWDEGEVVADTVVLAVPPDAGYRVELGWYLAATGERLTVADAAGNPIGDHVELGPFEVTP